MNVHVEQDDYTYQMRRIM